MHDTSFPLALALWAALPGASAGPAQDVEALRRALQSEVREERSEACRRIGELEGEARTQALSLLQAERRRWSSAHERAARKVAGLVSDYQRGATVRQELFARWEVAAREALGAIFDEQLFPDPPGPVSGPCQGYEAVQAQVLRARELYDKLLALAEKDLRAVLQMDRAKATTLHDELLRSGGRAEELGAWLGALGAPVEPLATLPALPLAALFLVSGDWERACARELRSPGEEDGTWASCQIDWAAASAAGASASVSDLELPAPAPPTVPGAAPRPLEGYERFLFHHLLGQRIEQDNATLDSALPGVVREAVAALNAYRRSLGVRPLQLHPKLIVAIRDHLWTIAALTHEGGSAQTATPALRAKTAGYPDPRFTGENLATADVVTAMEQWKWDGAHHRILVNPCAVHVGAFQTALSGMVVAAGDPPQLPSLCLWRFDL